MELGAQGSHAFNFEVIGLCHTWGHAAWHVEDAPEMLFC